MYNVTIMFNVNGQIISRNENDVTLLSDSIDLIKARFNFSPEWQGYTKTAIFKSSTKRAYSRILVDDVCMVPPEAIKKSKYMSVSVFGVSGTQLITATYQIVPLTPSGYTDDSIVSPAPTENIYQQIVTLMQKQAVDAVHAETAQGKAEQAERTAKSHAEQTGEDRIATGEDRVATGADRSAVNTALTGFAETTLPDAIQAVEDKADTEIARVGQAGDTQVQAVNVAGAEQIGLATAQADRAETAQGKAEDAQEGAETAATNAGNSATAAAKSAIAAAEHDILTQTEFTDEQKDIARQNINAAKMSGSYELIETITLTEDVAYIVRRQEPDGTPYAFKAIGVVMQAEVGSVNCGINVIGNYNSTRLQSGFINSAISNTIQKYGYVQIYPDRGVWTAIGSTAVNGFNWTVTQMTGYSPAQAFSVKESENPYCTQVTLQTTASGATIPAGTVISIYGVRA